MKFILNITGKKNLNSIRDESATMYMWFDHYTVNKSAMMFYDSQEQLVGMVLLNGNNFDYTYCEVK